LTRRAWEMHAETNHPPGIGPRRGVARADGSPARGLGHARKGLWPVRLRGAERPGHSLLDGSKRGDRLAVPRIPAPRSFPGPRRPGKEH
jgi:hypothetical protein